jgi:hypothetical protein
MIRREPFDCAGDVKPFDYGEGNVVSNFPVVVFDITTSVEAPHLLELPDPGIVLPGPCCGGTRCSPSKVTPSCCAVL